MVISKEAELSIAASSMFPGFKFSPTDEELLLFYLKKKVEGFGPCVEVITELDICKHEPWDLPGKSTIKSDHEWFFFSPRGKKYPNGSQSKRATELGYWKATGKERAVKCGTETVGTKRTLVFHIGRAPRGERTEWIMHEYCLVGNPQESLVICRLRKKNESSPYNASESCDVGSSNPLMVDGACSGSGWDPNTNLNPDPNRISAEMAIQCGSKKCTGSNESNSVGQNDHDSTHSLKEEGMELEPESSNRQLERDAEDDCFADILKDNIIELDETAELVRAATTSNTRAEGSYGGEAQSFVQQRGQSQGTASRRIRLKKARNGVYRGPRERSGEAKTTRLGCTRRASPLGKVAILTTMLAVLFALLGGVWQSIFCLCPCASV